MDGTNNQNQNKTGASSNTNQQNQKPGLSWTQPASTQTQQKTVKPVVAPEGDSTGRVIGTIVGVVVVFALAAWGIVALHKQSASNEVSVATSTDTTMGSATDTGTDTTAVAPTPTPVMVTSTPVPQPALTMAPAGSVSLTVPTPQDAGSTVSFSNLSTTQPTWIIVYESTQGAPGNILGAGLFFKGDTSGTISLLRSTTSGHDYLVSAALDNGDMSFTKANEKYVPDSSGAQMWWKFSTR